MQWAERCFESLRKATIKPDVYVVDNGSIDGTQTYIQKNYPEVMFHQSNTNLGFGKANNYGLQYALDNNYDYVYLLNQDAWVMPDTFRKLIEISQKAPEYGILSPFQMEANMQHIDKKFKIHVCAWESCPNMLDYMYLAPKKDLYEVETVMAAHWLITKKCIMKTGGFSPTFPHYGEDDNYIERAKYYGFKIGVSPLTQSVHDRENRQESISKKIYLSYIFSLRKMSNPNSPERVTKSLKSMLKNVVRYKSILPIKYIYKLIADYPKIKANLCTSQSKDCAFLNI